MKPRWTHTLRPLLLAALALLLVAAPFGAPAAAGEPIIIRFPIVSRNYPVGDIAVSRVEVVQGITMSDSYTVQVAQRPALLRVFVDVTGLSQMDNVVARLTRYVGGVAQDSLQVGPTTVYPAPNEGNLAHTLNFSLPDAWLAAGTSYVLELDPAKAIHETNEHNNRFPGGGQQSFNFVNVPTLDVVIVPIFYNRPGAPRTSLPDTSNLDYLTWMPFKVFPVSAINYTVRGSPVTFTGDLRYSSNGGQGWIDLLNILTDIHEDEDEFQEKLYYGLVDSIIVDGCSGGCIAGIAWVSQPFNLYSKTGLGFAGFPSDRNEASPTFTHEMGHNFGRRHSPCGVSGTTGPYPYPGGAPIGQWGYDTASGLMYHPTTYKDYMSYCGPEWTSDFTYKALADAWEWALMPYGQEVATSEALVLSGLIGADGTPVVESAFIETVPAALLAEAGGQYQLDVLDARGRVLVSQSFTPVSAVQDLWHGAHAGHAAAHDDSTEYLGFRVAMPVVAGAAGLRVTQGAAVLWERQVAGTAPDLAVATVADAGDGAMAWSLGAAAPGLTYRVSFSPDGGQTWTLLVARAASPAVVLPADLLAGASQPLVEVQASDGLRVTRQTYAVTPSR